MSVNPNKCIGARCTPGRKDRTWTFHLYIPKQCRNEPMEGSQLCSTCAYRKQRHSSGGPKVWHWHGTVTEPDNIPANARIFGSAWFHANCKKVPIGNSPGVIALLEHLKREGKVIGAPPKPTLMGTVAERLEAIEKRLTAVEKKLGQ